MKALLFGIFLMAVSYALAIRADRIPRGAEFILDIFLVIVLGTSGFVIVCNGANKLFKLDA